MKRIGAGALCLMAALSASAFADEIPVANTSVATISPNFTDHLTFSYWGNFNGPGFATPLSQSTNSDGSLTAAQMDTVLYAAYKFNDSLNLGPAIEFHYTPMVGQDIALNDLFLRLQSRHFVKTENFNWNASVGPLLPTDKVSRDRHMVGGLETVHIFNYDVPKTKLTIGVYSYLQGKGYTADFDTPNKQTELRLVVCPNAVYPISKSVQLTVWNDLYSLRHFRGGQGLQNDPTDIEPGFNWDVNAHLSVNPYFNIYTDTPTLSAAYFGFVVSGKLM